ncbi:hypothetical protein RJD38_22200 (plasmid) [Vibrio scophthalmi]|uniref:hypothetical protein n=1 Tax=Vibrio scophthalmi TaxID=45658 RepID=UPI00349F9D1D
MDRSLKEITCSSCNSAFSGVLDGYFSPLENYSAKCPQCGGFTSVDNAGAFIRVNIPDDAVVIIKTHRTKVVDLP